MMTRSSHRPLTMLFLNALRALVVFATILAMPALAQPGHTISPARRITNRPGHTANYVRSATGPSRQSFRTEGTLESTDQRAHNTNRIARTAINPPIAVSPKNTAISENEVQDFYYAAPVDAVFRGQSPSTFRAQSFDGPFREPYNPIYDINPQGNPLGGGTRQPPPGYVDLDIFATEGRTGRIMFGAGVNSDAGIVGSIVIDESNFNLFRPPRSFSDIIDGRAWRGGGQRFRLEAVPGDQVSRYLVSWTDPYFLHTDYNFSVSGFYFNRFYDDWDEQRLGGRVAIGKQLNPDWSFLTAIRLEDIEVTDPTVPTPQLLTDALGNNFLSTVQVSLTNDNRDTPVLPASGHFGQVSYEQAFGDFDYPRVEAEYRQYFTVAARPDDSGKQVFSIGGQLGWTGDDTPIFERFYAGGFQTFRGFQFRGVTPREGGVEVGGTWMAIGTAEYRVPITANDMIQLVAFTDFGTVENDVAFDNFRVTVGAGLRLTVPQMGPVPLAFDFGIPLVHEDSDERRVFSFYVGINR